MKLEISGIIFIIYGVFTIRSYYFQLIFATLCSLNIRMDGILVSSLLL